MPHRLLEEWAAKRRERGYLAIEEIAETAQLTDAQLDRRNARDVAVAVHGLREWERASISNFRHEWRLYNILTEEQQRSICTSAGLPFKELTQEQQEMVIKRFFATGSPQFQRDMYVESGVASGNTRRYRRPRKRHATTQASRRSTSRVL